MSNRFFDLALALASRMAGKPGRLACLVARMLMRVDLPAFRKLGFSAAREKLKQLGRLVAAYARGEYRRIPVKTIIVVTAGLLYFMNPFDFIPDALPGLGLTDDIAVLSRVYRRITGELVAFQRWEQTGIVS